MSHWALSPVVPEAKGNETCGFFPLWKPYSSLYGARSHRALGGGPQTRSEPTSRNHVDRVPSGPPVENRIPATTVLAGKGSLRRAKHRRALAPSAPFWPVSIATGGSGGNTIGTPCAKPTQGTNTPETASPLGNLSKSVYHVPGTLCIPCAGLDRHFPETFRLST